jgi:hypothetical protein
MPEEQSLMFLLRRTLPILTALFLAEGPAATRGFAATEGDAAFEAGIRASRAGRHEEALRQFQRARAAGLDRAALHYNLGVTYYRLGRYAEARASFRRVAEHETLGALVHYNLGLLALRLEEREQARRQFLIAHRLAKDEKLRRLAAVQLSRLSRVAGAEPRHSATIAAGAGYDDNLVVEDIGGAARGGDSFFELFLAGSATVHGTPRDGIKLHGSAYLVEYVDQNAFSMTILRGGAAQVTTWGGWRAEAGGDLELSTLGNRDYLRTLTASVAGKRAIAPTATFELRYRFSDIDARDSLFSQLNGYQHRLSVDAMHSRTDGWLSGRAFTEYNDREDLHGAGIFTSFSPVRMGLRAEYGRRLAADWEVSASLALTSSSYRDADVLEGGVEQRRKDQQLRVGLGLARNLGGRWQVGAEYQYYDNDSNIAAYAYRRNIYTLRVIGIF